MLETPPLFDETNKARVHFYLDSRSFEKKGVSRTARPYSFFEDRGIKDNSAHRKISDNWLDMGTISRED